MADTRGFILGIATENSIDPSRVEGVIQKLLDEWYETKESLKEITDTQWTTLGVPARLVDLIKKKLNTEKVEVKADSQEILNLLLEDLVKIGSEDLRLCMETIATILRNILKSSDSKYRKINKNNQAFYNKVARHGRALEYFKVIGFEENGEFLELRKENQNLIQENVGNIAEILANALNPFNPYEANIISTNSDNPKIVKSGNDPQVIESEIKRLNSEEFPIVNRNPQKFRVENVNLQTYFNKIDRESLDEALDEEASQLANIKSVMRQREETSKFKSKRKNELQNMKANRFYTVIIRIRFPDKMILQGEFSTKETTRDLYNFVKENLIQRERDFSVYEVPLKKTIKNGGHNLLPFAPATILYFTWSNLIETTEADGPFI